MSDLRQASTSYSEREGYPAAVRTAMVYGLETVALTKRQEAEMKVAEFKMLRFSLGVTRMGKTGNEYIRDSTGGNVWRENTIDKTEVVWTSTEETCTWEKDAEDDVAMKEETGKGKKEVYGCGER